MSNFKKLEILADYAEFDSEELKQAFINSIHGLDEDFDKLGLDTSSTTDEALDDFEKAISDIDANKESDDEDAAEERPAEGLSAGDEEESGDEEEVPDEDAEDSKSEVEIEEEIEQEVTLEIESKEEIEDDEEENEEEEEDEEEEDLEAYEEEEEDEDEKPGTGS